MNKIKTYLIHGALGSGKTTLLRKLMESKVFSSAVVIENEYANYNFDKDIISEEIKIYDVSGGCICCSSGRELFDTLNKIAKEKGIESLFIETTGVASSAQLIKQLLLSSEFDERYELTRNIYILDVLEDSLDSIKKEKVLDLAMADVIILNKTDLVLENKTQELKNFIQTVSDSHIITTTYGKVEPSLIHSDTKSKADRVLLDNLSNLSNYFVDHSKATLYQVLYPTKLIAESDLIQMLHLTRQNPDVEIFRIKGVFTNENNKRFSVNATRNHQEIAPLSQGPQNDVLVIIGKNITRDRIQALEKRLC